MSENPNQARFTQLDALRGVAALWVVVYHWTSRYDELFGHASDFTFRFFDGRIGVYLFFMISGFVILMTLDRTRSIFDFIFFRFARLYPTFLLCMLITWLAVSLCGLTGRTVPFVHGIFNLTMIPNILGFKMIDPVYWSLEVEIFFYGLMAVLCAARLRRYLVVILTSLVVCNIALLLLPGSVNDLPPFVKAIRLLCSMRYLNSFLFGIVCFERIKARHPLQYLVFILCIMQAFLDEGRVSGWECLGMGVLFYGATHYQLSWLSARPLLFFGSISYPLYVLHQNLGFISIRYLLNLGFSTTVSLLSTFVLIVALSTIVSKAWEYPSNTWLRGWYKNRRMRVLSARGKALIRSFADIQLYH
jgi:peptidoglycan/LPS O-acetylase OafA/YrhL